jgi:hypothetical protein
LRIERAIIRTGLNAISSSSRWADATNLGDGFAACGPLFSQESFGGDALSRTLGVIALRCGKTFKLRILGAAG